MHKGVEFAEFLMDMYAKRRKKKLGACFFIGLILLILGSLMLLRDLGYIPQISMWGVFFLLTGFGLLFKSFLKLLN